MASIPATYLLYLSVLITISPTSSTSIIEDLNNIHPPPDFNTIILNNCAKNPSLRYCNNPSPDFSEIFKSTIVTNHLCHESNNTNCPDSFVKIDLQNRKKFAPLYLSFSFFWKYCPLTILSIDLSNSSLKGDFPTDILHCSQIQTLDLSLNGLSGEFPLESFTQLINLTCLNLSYNHFSESKISDTQFFKRFNSSSFVHSGLVPDYHEFQFKAFVLLFGFPLCVVLVVICLGFICFLRPDYLPLFLQSKYKFTPAMLKAATDKYSPTNLVAKIGKFEIYRGTLREGTEVRIEIYRETIPRQEYKKFVAECKVLVQLHQKNLVQVLGWCNHRGYKAVILEWREGKTINLWLLNSLPTWKQRLKVLRKILEGVLYLQEHWPEVGFDLTTSSVLLSKEGEPLISRFRVGDGNSNKKNIYKFGVLLLEMIANKQSKDFKQGEASLIEWVKTHYQENIWKVIDDRLRKTGITPEQADKGIRFGIMCAEVSTEHHFKMAQVYDIITRFYESTLISRSPNH
ncbi:hypothetical protein AQUCO_03000409v1 [Aquilegia coerulea]|uniref:Protein kinase domain-containing protein n=1 Tax=Aquilegia coerulea TaxID=218851 RepID=A0A2G5D2V1_AQUCA|nr:hypothetical protein AQUCO_03000409v1 [Aquilegia coerulea]